MNAYDICQFLLALDHSSAQEASDRTQGFLGRGWYKNLNGSNRIRMITGKAGEDRHFILDVYKNEEGAWMVSEFSEREGPYEGTQMVWYKHFTGSGTNEQVRVALEAAIIGESLQNFAGALPAVYQRMDLPVSISFNGIRLVESLEEMGKVSWPGSPGEWVRLVRRSSGKTGVLQHGFFVMGMEQDPDLWRLVPHHLRVLAESLGLSLEIPGFLPLNRERSGLAGKEGYIDILQRSVLAVLLQAVAREKMFGHLPEDYLYRSSHLMKPSGKPALEVARAFNSEAWSSLDEQVISRVLQDPEQFRQLLIHTEAWDLTGEHKISFAGLRQEIFDLL
jgi:hypothetical protein